MKESWKNRIEINAEILAGKSVIKGTRVPIEVSIGLKRKELLKIITAAGCLPLQRGQRHDLYINPKTGKRQPVPRHNEMTKTSHGI